VTVQAALSRITLPLSAVVQMKPGDLLPLPLAALDRIEITGQDGQPCAVGRLGQSRGMRALRLRHVGAPEETAMPEMATVSSKENGPHLRLAATG
jgi:flagellar motor switch protein FliM